MTNMMGVSIHQLTPGGDKVPALFDRRPSIRRAYCYKIGFYTAMIDLDIVIREWLLETITNMGIKDR